MTGAQRLSAFLDSNKLSLSEAARQLGVTKTALHEWVTGHQRPKTHYRAAIERWTSGAVPALAWATREEKKAVAGVVPFKASGTEG